MFTPTGCSQRGTDGNRSHRIARGARRRVARSLVAASLAVVALYAITGSVAPAYAGKLPTVTSVTPGGGPATGGTVVTIGGTHFKQAKAVRFGSTNATSFTVHSPTSMTAVSPPGATAGKVDVRVTTKQGTSPISSNDTFEFTPTVTSVSPNTGPPAGGTAVTITGSGFAVGVSATRITFGDIEEETEREAVGVNCTTTTECTATTPELSEEEARVSGTVDVRATVNNVVSPQTAADQFFYHGLYLRDEGARMPVGAEVIFHGSLGTSEFMECFALVRAIIASNGEATDEIDTGVAQFVSCNQKEWFGALPFSYPVRLGDDGSATIEAPLGLRTREACLYEGTRMDGSFELNAPLDARLGGTLTLVAEEEPGAECAATEHVDVFLGGERAPETELVG